MKVFTLVYELGQYMRKSWCSRNDSNPVHLRWCWCSSNALTFGSCIGRINISARSTSLTYNYYILWIVKSGKMKLVLPCSFTKHPTLTSILFTNKLFFLNFCLLLLHVSLLSFYSYILHSNFGKHNFILLYWL